MVKRNLSFSISCDFKNIFSSINYFGLIFLRQSVFSPNDPVYRLLLEVLRECDGIFSRGATPQLNSNLSKIQSGIIFLKWQNEIPCNIIYLVKRYHWKAKESMKCNSLNKLTEQISSQRRPTKLFSGLTTTVVCMYSKSVLTSNMLLRDYFRLNAIIFIDNLTYPIIVAAAFPESVISACIPNWS